jgi:hypothetical protein
MIAKYTASANIPDDAFPSCPKNGTFQSPLQCHQVITNPPRLLNLLFNDESIDKRN